MDVAGNETAIAAASGERSARFFKKIGALILGCTCFGAAIFAMLLVLASVALMIPSCTGAFAFGYVMKFSPSGVLAYAFAVLAAWAVVEFWHRRWPTVFGRWEVWFLVFGCFLVSLCFIKLLPALLPGSGPMTRDPSLVLESIKAGKICFTHPMRNQYWCNYEILCSILSVIFDGDLEFGRAFQAAMCALAIYPVFCISERVSGRRFARFVVLSMGFSPTLVMYSMILTSEFLSASLLAFSALFFLRGYEANRSRQSALACFLLSGVLWGGADLFKPMAFLVVAAIGVMAFLFLCLHGRRCCFAVLMTVLVLLPAFHITRKGGQTALAELAGEPRLAAAGESASSELLYELALGLNVAKEGFWDGRLARSFLAMSDRQQHDFVREMLRRDWRKYPMLMVHKFRNIHGSNIYHHGGVSCFTYMFRDKRGAHRCPRWIAPLTDNATLFFKVMFLLGAVGLLMSMRRPLSFLAPGLFAALVVLGFAVVEQLIEGHGRYKTAIYPFYFMIVPYACVFWGKVNSIRNRISGLVGILMRSCTGG